MKYKQSNPKSVRPTVLNLSSNGVMGNINKQRVRCSLCDSLLKAPSSHRYLLMGKSIHDTLIPNDKTSITYGQCCERYLNDMDQSAKLHMICPKCCADLQHVHALQTDVERLKEKFCRSWCKTKRLNRTRNAGYSPPLSNSKSNDDAFCSLPTIDETLSTVVIKEELMTESLPLPTVLVAQTRAEKIPFAPEVPLPVETPERTTAQNVHDALQLLQSFRSVKSTVQPYVENHGLLNGSKKKHRPHLQHPLPTTMTNDESNMSSKPQLIGSYSTFLSPQVSRPLLPSEHEYCHNYMYHPQTVAETPALPYAQLMIDPPSSTASPRERRRSSSSSEQPPLVIGYDRTLDGERSLSPRTNDDETSSINGSKSTRLSRRQYDFLIKLPDQQSLNSFIETSAAESGSRWTWRRTSANSRGYKVYYVCNFSMRRHYHPCPAAMYALFHPEGCISIYSCGQHQHIPKDRLPVSITDASKDEIFKCLQAGMSTTDIREHLTRLQLPFGDTRKLNNFIKYHKELLRFGTVTNVRVGGTAYRQPQCWAIRRQPPGPPANGSAPTS